MKPLNLTSHSKMQTVLDSLQDVVCVDQHAKSPEFQQYFQYQILPDYPSTAQLSLLLHAIWYAFSPMIETIILISEEEDIHPELRSLPYLQHQSNQNFKTLPHTNTAYVFLDQPATNWPALITMMPPSHLCFFATRDSISQVVVLQSAEQNVLPHNLYVSYR